MTYLNEIKIIQSNFNDVRKKNHRNFRKEENFGVSEFNIAYRKQLKAHIIPCPLTSSFYRLFIKVFNVIFLGWEDLSPEENCL